MRTASHRDDRTNYADAMQSNLWAPWRMTYLRDLQRKSEVASAGPITFSAPVNFLAAYWSAPQDDAQNLIVHRDAHGMILLNRYPYANGHLLVALGDARSTLSEYEPSQRAQFWRLVDMAMDLVERVLRPQGINMGINIGSAAGAGLPEHVHAHVVPRWVGDTNFMSVLGDVRLIPEDLEKMAVNLRRSLAEQPGHD